MNTNSIYIVLLFICSIANNISIKNKKISKIYIVDTSYHFITDSIHFYLNVLFISVSFRVKSFS